MEYCNAFHSVWPVSLRRCWKSAEARLRPAKRRNSPLRYSSLNRNAARSRQVRTFIRKGQSKRFDRRGAIETPRENAVRPNDSVGLLLKPPSQLRYHLIGPLRGLAAVWVFVFHFSFSHEFQSAFPACHALLKAGHRVPMFFVISGYCLAAALSRAIVRGQSFRDFLMQRARRIFPTFWLSIVVIVALHFGGELLKGALTGEWNSLNFGRFRRYGWFDWIKIASLTQIFDQRFGLFYQRFGRVNGAYWTLGIEFQFYLIVALGLLRPRWFLPLTSVLTAVSLAQLPQLST